MCNGRVAMRQSRASRRTAGRGRIEGLSSGAIPAQDDEPTGSMEKTMNRETTYKGKVEGWERLSERLTANAGELAHLETSRAKLEGLMTQARQVAAVQAAQTAAKQQASQAMKTVIAEGDRLANVLMVSIKEHYGPRSEKVAEFGAQPFRGRKV